MLEALPLGSEQDVHQYGRSQLAAKELESAYKVFMANYDKHPNTYTTNMGMARALSAKGEFQKSMDYLKAALLLAPDAVHKTIESYMKTLEGGKDFN
jgi:tetratricopeptide (TPR) repeat protein